MRFSGRSACWSPRLRELPPERYRRQLRDAARLARAVGAEATARLADELYDRWYAPARGEVREPLAPQVVAAHLRAADASGARFERGWTVLATAEATTLLGPPRSTWQIPAARDGEALWIDPADLLYEGHVGIRPPAGTPVAVSARRDSIAEPFGWWTTFGEAWATATQPLVRLYWSVRPERLFALVETLTGGLDPGSPWALKCPLDPERSRRPDAVVLYLPVDAWPRMRSSVADVYSSSRESLASSVPALTLQLEPGLALAEDPGDESFGTARCRMIAEGIVRAKTDGEAEEAALARAAEQTLVAHGVSLEAPYLNPGSRARYEWTTP
jgi:hypothetical protein